jgi:type II secretory pathway pseudopilin PulG
MIELVIAIVVMGIAVMTLPLMLERTQENNAFAMQQEAILAARTELGDVLTFPWDENSIQNDVVGVLDVHANADNELDRNTTQRRVGHVLQDRRRKFFSANTQATTPLNLGNDGNLNDIDDFIGVNNYNLSGNLDYRFDFDMNTSVVYINDAANYAAQDMAIFTFDRNASNTSTNIKLVSVILDINATDTSFRLDAYSTNIGGSSLLRRAY